MVTGLTLVSPRPRPIYEKPPSGGVLFRRAVRKSSISQSVFVALRTRGNLPRIAVEMCRYFTDIIPARDADEPLITRCLRKAVLAHGDATRNRTGDDWAYKQFIRGMLLYSDEALSWYVYIRRQGRDIVWDPSDGSLSNFWEQNRREPRILRRDEPWDTIPPQDIRLMIDTKFLNRNDLTVLDGGLQAILE